MHVAQSPERSARRGVDRRTADLLEAAASVFLERGYDGASMEQVASQAGVTRKTVYNHFSSREDLFAAVVNSLCERIGVALDDAEHRGGSVEERLTGFCLAIVDRLMTTPGLEIYRLIVSIAPRFPALAETLRDASDATITAALARRLDDEVARGSLTIPDARRAAYILIAIATGPVQRTALGEPLSAESADIDAYVREAVEMFCTHYRSGREKPQS